MLAAVKYRRYLYATPYHRRDLTAFADVEGDPSLDFNESWVEAWERTSNYGLWHRFTDAALFDIVDPRHPTAGTLSLEDINRRLAQQVQDLHLDERLASSRDVLGKHLATGQKKVSTAFRGLWADLEARREGLRQQRGLGKKQGERQQFVVGGEEEVRSPLALLPSPSRFVVESPERTPGTPAGRFDGGSPAGEVEMGAGAGLRARAPDLGHAGAVVGAAGQRAGAYFSSWGVWAAERRKGWGGGMGVGTKSRSGWKGGVVGEGETGEKSGEGGRVSDAGAGGDVRGRGDPDGGGDAGRGFGLGGRAKVKTPVKTVRRTRSSREEIGVDGIGRLDA